MLSSRNATSYSSWSPGRCSNPQHGSPPTTFARNDLAFDDPTGCDHEFFAAGLRKAVYNFMHGVGLDADPRSWFERPRAQRAKRPPKIPQVTVPKDLIRRALDAASHS